MTRNPDPERIADCLWQHLWLDVRDHFGDHVRLGIPRNGGRLGYHLTRAEHSKGNYSVQRPVDKLGPADRVSAMDWLFPAARTGDNCLGIVTATRRIMKAYGDPADGRIGTHNMAEWFGTVDGETVVGRVHGRYSSGSATYLYVVHVALNRQWADNAYVCRSVASVVTGESHSVWLQREHPRVRDDA